MPDMAEPAEHPIPAAQFAKGIEVDDKVYDPNVFVNDWACEYFEVGGEG